MQSRSKSIVIFTYMAFFFPANLSTPASAEKLHSVNYVTIGNNSGGVIVDYALRSKTIEESGRGIRFKGSCLSSCTLYLAVARSCVSRGASFGFHLPYGSSKRNNMAAANYMIKAYPQWVRSWLSINGGLERRIKIMKYDYISRHLPVCDA